MGAGAGRGRRGVKMVISGQGLPELASGIYQMGEIPVNPRYLSMNIMARDKVLYTGHAVAAVAATSPHIAAEALHRIQVEYEALPPVMDVLEAMKADAPLLHDDIYTDTGGEKSNRPSNVAAHLIFEEGDVEAGFRQAHLVLEREYRTATVHQGYIEPHNAVAEWRADGQLTVWCSTQGAFPARTQLAHILQHPVSQIKVVPAEIGGGFGGKIMVYLEPVAALLARKTGRPGEGLVDPAEGVMGP